MPSSSVFNIELIEKISHVLKDHKSSVLKKPVYVRGKRKRQRSFDLVPALYQEQGVLDSVNQWLEESLATDQKINGPSPVAPPALSSRAQSFLAEIDRVVTQDTSAVTVIPSKVISLPLEFSPLLKEAFEHIDNTRKENYKKSYHGL